jgi:hypothetical protein
MVRRKTEIIDDDGNELAPPDPTSHVGQVIYLLEYGRKRGFRIGPTVQIGDVIVQVADIRQQTDITRAQQTEAPDLVSGSDMAVLLGSEE